MFVNDVCNVYCRGYCGPGTHFYMYVRIAVDSGPGPHIGVLDLVLWYCRWILSLII